MKARQQIVLFAAGCFFLCAMTSSAQAPFEKYFFPPGAASFVNVVQSPKDSGYMVVGNISAIPNVSARIWVMRTNGQGDSLWTKSFYAHTAPGWGDVPDLQAVGMCATSDSGCFILAYNRKGNGSCGCQFNTVMKINAQGDSVWSVAISDSSSCWATPPYHDIVATPDGGCIIAGGQTVDQKHAILTKMRPDGTIAWSNTSFPASDADRFAAVCLTSDGGYIAAGTEGYFDARILIAKVNSTDSTLWSREFYSGNLAAGDGRRAEAMSVAPTSDGGCLLTGYVSDSGSNTSAVLVMRMSSAGDSLWTKTYFHPAANSGIGAEGFKLAPLSSGQYALFTQKAAGSTAAGATLLRINSSGDSLWSQVGYIYCIGMKGIDRDSGILFTGYTQGSNQGTTFIRTTAGGLYRSPTPQSPSDGSTGDTLCPLLTWTGQPHLVYSYHAQVAQDSAFGTIIKDTTITGDSVLRLQQLSATTKYFWRVQSSGKSGGPTQWSGAWSFTTRAGSAVKTKNASKLRPTQILYEAFNPSIKACFSLAERDFVNMRIWDLSGRKVATCLSEELPAGSYVRAWDVRALPSGVYYCSLQAGNTLATRKLVVLK